VARKVRSTALAVAAAVVYLGAVASLGVDRDSAAAAVDGSAPSAAASGLPPGWRQIKRPISGVIYPRQVLAAATYPVTFSRRPQGYLPGAALSQMPADGVLLQIIEYAPTGPSGKPLRVPRLPRRPDRFSYDDATYARFECAGPSYKFDYRQAGHALQAQIWMKLNTVDPLRRAEALRILNHFQPER
jgi:hypothetical protein